MAKEPPPLVVEFGTHETLVFNAPSEVTAWLQKEKEKWEGILNAGVALEFKDRFNKALEQIRNETNQWQHALQQDEQAALDRSKRLAALIREWFMPNKLLISSSPKAIFVLQIQSTFGAIAAAAAYAFIVGSRINLEGAPDTAIFTGLIQAFLFKNDIEWSAQAHHQALEKLKGEYQGNILDQRNELKALEERNQQLNERYSSTLTAKSADLDTLHQSQNALFEKMAADHVKKLTDIENTYDAKLALSKPVRYWKVKRLTHTKSAKVFLGWSIVVGILATGGLSLLAYETFGKLQTGESPQHWQIGVLIVGAFFAIWALRLVVRMLLSHLHLATDAGERETMVLTFLALSREGKNVAPDDKKLILDHLFRTASDGLVKDDGAPPSVFELFTRSR